MSLDIDVAIAANDGIFSFAKSNAVSGPSNTFLRPLPAAPILLPKVSSGAETFTSNGLTPPVKLPCAQLANGFVSGIGTLNPFAFALAKI